MSLLQALSPGAVAILGASDNPTKAGGRPIDYRLRHGFAGRILPVSPGAVVISLPGEYVAAAIRVLRR